MTWGSPVGGTLLTLKLARRHRKPYFLVDMAQGGNASEVLDWAQKNNVHTLNIAGPRESEAPGIYSRAISFLKEFLTNLNM